MLTTDANGNIINDETQTVTTDTCVIGSFILLCLKVKNHNQYLTVTVEYYTLLIKSTV